MEADQRASSSLPTIIVRFTEVERGKNKPGAKPIRHARHSDAIELDPFLGFASAFRPRNTKLKIQPGLFVVRAREAILVDFQGTNLRLQRRFVGSRASRMRPKNPTHE